jgi:hypothetical protein
MYTDYSSVREPVKESRQTPGYSLAEDVKPQSGKNWGKSGSYKSGIFTTEDTEVTEKT